MSTETGGRITLLIALACWIVPVFGAGIAFIGWGWWRWWRDWSPERQRQLQAEAQVWLDGAVAGLTPWRPVALGDLSTVLSDRSREFASFTAQGTVDSRSGAARWIAFSLVQNYALDEERRSSVVLARTTRQH
jgi:hypothetical protein